MFSKIKTNSIILIGNIFGIALQFLALLLSFFRKQLFGVEPGNAPPNFSLNVGLIFPLIFFSILLTFIILIISFWNWKRLNISYFLFGTIPFIIFLFYFLFQVFWVFRQG
jgi:hypothetical protein